MVVTLRITKSGKNWVFDYPEKGIKDEPFVEGTSELIDSFIEKDHRKEPHIIVASDKLVPQISNEYYSISFLQNYNKDTKWSDYRNPDFGNHRLCPVLLEFFGNPPLKIYFFVKKE